MSVNICLRCECNKNISIPTCKGYPCKDFHPCLLFENKASQDKHSSLLQRKSTLKSIPGVNAIKILVKHEKVVYAHIFLIIYYLKISDQKDKHSSLLRRKSFDAQT